MEGKLFMKRKNNRLCLFLCLALMITYLLPSQSAVLYAEGYATVDIIEVNQSSSSLQPGDTFSLIVKVTAGNIKPDYPAYISHAYASGSGIDTSNMGFSVKDNPEITGTQEEHVVVVSGLKYTGGSKEVEVTVEVADQLGSSANSVTPYNTDVESYTLSAKTSDEFSDVINIEKQENLLVKTGETQNVKVKLTNTSTFTLNQAEMTLSLNSKIKGLEITSNKATVKNLKPKETKSGSFTIKASEDVQAGVYPATVTVLGNSFSVNIQVDSNVVPSALEVSAAGSTIYTPGVSGNVNFVLSNVGQRDAKNIRFEVVNSEDISIVEASNVKRLDVISARSSQTISMKVKINSSYKGDAVPVQIKLQYLNSNGEKEEDVQYIYLSTSASSAASEVVISNVISPTGIYQVDQNFTIKFNLSSVGGAENLKIVVKGDEGIVPKSQNLFFLNKLGKGETKQYSVTLAATNGAISSSHAIEISVEYGDSKDPTTISQYGSVNITNPKKDEEGEDGDKLKGKPKVIIGEYVVNPTIVQAGENFELDLGFLNTNREHTVYNLKANVTIIEEGENKTGNVFTPVGGSNTFYIDQLAPGETQTKHVTMYTIPSALAKTYEITLEMEYEDEKGNEIQASEKIGIPVEQETSIEVGDIYVDYAQVGMDTTLSATVYNRGRTDVTNMMVYIEGMGFTVAENKNFVGNFNKGDSTDYNPTLTPNEAGVLKGELVIEYEDTSGKTQEIRKAFEFTVEEMMIDEGMIGEEGMMPEAMPVESPNKTVLYIGIAIGIIVSAVVTLIVLKKRKAKKEEMMFDEED